ncbi:MAG TPA: TonB-dependent receptor [Bryobacteraceae bacterium]|nr:TonB-dependent receptor [Bryobacteraceae bacterium]
MNRRCAIVPLFVCLAVSPLTRGQDPDGAIEGLVTDQSESRLAAAHVTARNLDTGFSKTTLTGANGFFRIPLLPVGQYNLTVEMPNFASLRQGPIRVEVSQTARVELRLEVASIQSEVTVSGAAPLVDTSTNTLGGVVTGREITDLPLNGRNFTQLGLLQTGAAALTGGLIQAGGPLRQGQTYAVNGARPEQNMYMIDGAQNVNRMDAGYALKIPVDAIEEFRILTQTAPPEYGGTAGATTTVVTRSGGNEFHGGLYAFVRNDKLDTRNFFSSAVEPLKQNQFGGTAGGPIRRDRLFFFAYYEGFRNRQGLTTSATVPSAQQRAGDFSGLTGPLLNLAAGGAAFPNNRIPAPAINPVAWQVLGLYPLGNVSPNLYRTTVVGANNYDQAGGRLDFNASSKDRVFARFSWSGGYDFNPVSVRGTPVPGFPTRDDLKTDSAELSDTHVFSPSLTNSLRGSFLHYLFNFDLRLNQTPPAALGFTLPAAVAAGQGPPFFNIVGYSPIGGAITGPRDSSQNTYEAQDGLSWIHGAHAAKFGAEYVRTPVSMYQGIAPNSFFVFASTFPTNDAIANLLLGAPVTFYQGLGDFHRGLRNWGLGGYAQDEWRISPRITLNYGLRFERVNPITEIQDRLNAFVPGEPSKVYPNAPTGLLFPGDPGIAKGIAPGDNAFMPRIGFAWDPRGDGAWAIRSAYGVFYDQFQNGPGTASQVPISALPAAQFNQFSGAGLNFASPYLGHTVPAPNTFVSPSTVFGIDPRARAPYVQNWNFGIQHSLFRQYLIEARYAGSKGTHLPRNIEANPAVYGPGATAQNADQRRIYAGCPPKGGPCTFSTIAELANITNSTYEAGQVSLSRRYAAGLGFNVSYWFSKSLDYLSSMNLAGASSQPLAGANDLAQNPFDLAAEHGPSLFDARHRLVASGSWEPRVPKAAPAAVRRIFGGWQINVIASHNSPTPFTVYDSTNVSLQANSPPISGYPASRPNLVGDPNAGPHSVQQWISPAAFQRLNPVTQAGQFGNAGRNIARGPAFTDLDASLTRNFRLTESVRLQFRAESFNTPNHANFGLPVADLNSPNFGQILSAASPRLLQFALKLSY